MTSLTFNTFINIYIYIIYIYIMYRYTFSSHLHMRENRILWLSESGSFARNNYFHFYPVPEMS